MKPFEDCVVEISDSAFDELLNALSPNLRFCDALTLKGGHKENLIFVAPISDETRVIITPKRLCGPMNRQTNEKT